MVSSILMVLFIDWRGVLATAFDYRVSFDRRGVRVTIRSPVDWMDDEPGQARCDGTAQQVVLVGEFDAHVLAQVRVEMGELSCCTAAGAPALHRCEDVHKGAAEAVAGGTIVGEVMDIESGH